MCHKVFLHHGGVCILEISTLESCFPLCILSILFLMCEAPIRLYIYTICCDSVHLLLPKTPFLNRFTFLTRFALQSESDSKIFSYSFTSYINPVTNCRMKSSLMHAFWIEEKKDLLHNIFVYSCECHSSTNLSFHVVFNLSLL